MYVNGNAIAKSTSHEFSYNLGVREVTNKDSANTVENLPANKSWEASCDAFYTFDATYAFDDLYTLVLNRTAVTLLMARSENANSADTYYSGSAYVTSLSLSTPNEGENATYSVSFTGTGALTKLTIT